MYFRHASLQFRRLLVSEVLSISLPSGSLFLFLLEIVRQVNPASLLSYSRTPSQCLSFPCSPHLRSSDASDTGWIAQGNLLVSVPTVLDAFTTGLSSPVLRPLVHGILLPDAVSLCGGRVSGCKPICLSSLHCTVARGRRTCLSPSSSLGIKEAKAVVCQTLVASSSL